MTHETRSAWCQASMWLSGSKTAMAPKLFEKPSQDAEAPAPSPQGFEEIAAQPPVRISKPQQQEFQQSEAATAAAEASLKQDAECNDALSAVSAEPAAEHAELSGQTQQSAPTLASGATDSSQAESGQQQETEAGESLQSSEPVQQAQQEAAPATDLESAQPTGTTQLPETAQSSGSEAQDPVASEQASETEQKASDAAELRRQMAELRQAMADKAVAMQAAEARTARQSQPEASTPLVQSMPLAEPQTRQDSQQPQQQQRRASEAQSGTQTQSMQQQTQLDTQTGGQQPAQSSQEAQSLSQGLSTSESNTAPQSQLQLEQQPGSDTGLMLRPASDDVDSRATSTDTSDTTQPSSTQRMPDATQSSDRDAQTGGPSTSSKSQESQVQPQGQPRQPFQVLPRPPSSSSSAAIFVEPAPDTVRTSPAPPDRPGEPDAEDIATDLVGMAAAAMLPHPDKAETGGTHCVCCHTCHFVQAQRMPVLLHTASGTLCLHLLLACCT